MGSYSCCLCSAPPEEELGVYIKETQPEVNKDNKSEEESLGLSENEVNEMMGQLQLLLSFLQKRAVNKETIGQGGQGKIRKYYSYQYQREVVEKITNLNYWQEVL